MRERLLAARCTTGTYRGARPSTASSCFRTAGSASRRFAKGADELPADITAPLTGALVRSLDEAELRRALASATAAYAAELEHSDPALAERLWPMLAELVAGCG